MRFGIGGFGHFIRCFGRICTCCLRVHFLSFRQGSPTVRHSSAVRLTSINRSPRMHSRDLHTKIQCQMFWRRMLFIPAASQAPDIRATSAPLHAQKAEVAVPSAYGVLHQQNLLTPHAASETARPHHPVVVTCRLIRILSPINRITIEKRHQIAGISFGLVVRFAAKIGPATACTRTNRHAPYSNGTANATTM